MSCRTIAGIAVLLFGGVIASSAFGQQSEPSPNQGVSLSDRFTSIRDSLFKKKTPSGQESAQISAESRSTGPKKLKNRRSSIRRDSMKPARSMNQQHTPQGLPLPKVEIGKVLPENLFGNDQKKQPESRRNPEKEIAMRPNPSLRRVGSAAQAASQRKTARKSPVAKRENELDAALTDLFMVSDQTPTPSNNEAVLDKSLDNPSALAVKEERKTAQGPENGNSIDLRDALLGDQSSESLISEVAADEIDNEEATNAPIPLPMDEQPTAEEVANTPVESESVQQPEVETIHPEDIVVQPAPQTEATPEIVSAPAQQVVEQVAPVQETIEPEAITVQPAPEVQSVPVVVSNPPQQTIEQVAPKQTEPVVEAIQPVRPMVVDRQPAITHEMTTSQPQQFHVAIPQKIEESPSIDPFDQAAEQAFQPQPQQETKYYTSQKSSNRVLVQSPPAATEDVLKTSRQPVIVSHVEGPRSILVGQEATYEVTLENTSVTAANRVASVIRVPDWAELVGAISTSGSVKRLASGNQPGALQWQIEELDGRSSETLRLRIIPRSGRPLQLGVEWSQAPAQTRTLVQVQEPKLDMSITGPEEVLFGKPQRYQLHLQNPGTGVTKNIAVRLIPPGGDAQSAATQEIGDLKPGQMKQIELELTAREGGKLVIEASASANGGLTADTVKNVLCRKPELDVDWRGPQKKYAGTEAAYYFRVKNPGTAGTEPVRVHVKLPPESKFVAASDGFAFNSATGVVSWQLAGIGVDEEQFMQVRCELGRAGSNQFEIAAQTDKGELRDIKQFETNVIAMADLKLEVTDPPGPSAVGEAVVYEIRVLNRGTSDAENISIIGLFSEGIEPTDVEGAQFSIRDGRVTFLPIKVLPPEHEVRLRIKASATQAGTHIFRAEAVCRELDIKLAVEETTRFYQDENRWEKGQTPYTAERAKTSRR